MHLRDLAVSCAEIGGYVSVKSGKLMKRDEFIGSGPVRYRIDGPPESPKGASIAIDYSTAPVPKHYYMADYAYLRAIGTQVFLSFGKWNKPLNGDKLRNQIEIYVPAYHFLRQFWLSSRSFHQSLRNYAEQTKQAPEPIATELLNADKIQTFYSNNILMVLSAGEAMVDFFYLSPRDLFLKIPKKKEIDLEALVRVVVSPLLLLSFLDACEPIVEGLKQSFPEEKGGENEAMEP